MVIYSPVISGSLTISGSILTTGGGLPLTGSLVSSGSFTSIGATVVSGSFTVITGSSIELQVLDTGVRIGNLVSDNHNVTGSLLVSGSITTVGTITAQTLVVQTVTSSVSFITGSTKFGVLASNTHQFTGSVLVTGSVGIGTTPNITAGITELAIGSSNTNPLINGIRDGVSAFSLNSDSSGTRLLERRNLELTIGTNNTTRLTIASSGAATFSNNLAVGGSTDDTSGGLYTNIAINATTYSRYSLLTGGTARARFQFDGTNTSITTTSTGGKLQLATAAATSMEFITNDSLKMTITSGGNVGIGTNSPTSKLFVLGNGSYNTTTSEILASDATIFSSEMSNDAYNSILQLVSVRQSLSTGASSQGFLGFSTIDDSNGQGIRDAGRIAIVNESVSARNSPTALAFWTNSAGTNTGAATEKMRITSGGFVGIGTNSPATRLHIEAASQSYGQVRILNLSGTGEASINFGRTDQTIDNRWTVGQGTASVGDTFGFYTAGSNKATLTTAGVWSTTGGGTSDLRTKEDIDYNFDNGMESISKLQPTKFKFKSAPNKQRRGFIAQDVLETIPDLVLGDGELENGTYGLDYDGILALAVKAIQELKSENDTLKEILQRNNIQ